VNHGEGQLATLLDVEFGDAQMQGRGHVVGRGATCHDVDFGILFHDHDVVHCKSADKGVEVLGIRQALKKYDGLPEYFWKAMDPGDGPGSPDHGHGGRGIGEHMHRERAKAAQQIENPDTMEEAD